MAATLKCDLAKGLTPEDFDARDGHFGSNYKAPPQRTPFCRLFLGALDDFMLKLLMVCAFVSITVEMYFSDHKSIGILFALFLYLLAWIEGTAILVAVLVVSSVGAWNDYKKEE